MQNKKADREKILKLPRTTVTQHPTLPQHYLFLADDCFETQKDKQNTVADVSFPIHHQSLRSDSFSHCACCWVFVLTAFYFSHCISCFVATLTVIHISFCHRLKFRTLLSVSGTARDTAVALMFSIWYCARHCCGSYVQYLILRKTLQWLFCSVSGTARDTAVALVFSIWYYARHCSGPYVQYLVLRETLQWPLCSVSGTVRDTAVANNTNL